MIIFFDPNNQQQSNKKRFGICDAPPPVVEKAYIDERNGQNWIAIVENFYQEAISFMPVDNCIDIRKSNGKPDSRCDGFLYFDTTIIFIELKERKTKGHGWVDDADKQLRITIGHFENTPESDIFKTKKAYIANSKKPDFSRFHAVRMEKFLDETNYVLRITNRIHVDDPTA
ncbi:MAG: hypothetical protein LUH15_16000 [Tannerellaceae bacterium]|nr:hypothetical protein [Tannerellaceae bacterium]